MTVPEMGALMLVLTVAYVACDAVVVLVCRPRPVPPATKPDGACVATGCPRPATHRLITDADATVLHLCAAHADRGFAVCVDVGIDAAVVSLLDEAR